MQATAGGLRMEFHVTIDFNDDLWFAKGRWDEACLRKLVRFYAERGIAAIHWIDFGGKAGGFYEPGTWMDGLAPATYFFDLVPEPLSVLCDEARKVGLRVYSVLKVFDLAAGAPWSSRTPDEAKATPGLPHVGGIGNEFHWIRAHPHVRAELHPKLKHRPAGGSVQTIRLWHENAALPACAWELLVSDNNRDYRPYGARLDIASEVRVRRAPIFEPAPNARLGEPAECACVEFRSLDLNAPYVALMAKGPCAFANTLAALVEIEDGAGQPVPFTYGLGPVRKHGQTPDWRTQGIAFDAAYGTKVPGRGWTMEYSGGRTRIDLAETGWIGLARGRNTHLTAVLEPVYPEVRAFVGEMARKAMDAGCAGVDLRVTTHGESLDWENYGFNAPLLEAFRRRHGVDPAAQAFDRGAWRRLRGEYFTQLVRETSVLVRARGGQMLAHLHDLFDRPVEKEALHEIHFDWRTWLRERMLDGGTLNSFAFREPFYRDCIRLCREHGAKPVMNHPMHTADDAGWKTYGYELIERAHQDGCDAFNIYESAYVARLEHGSMVELTPSLWSKVREMTHR